MPLDPKQQPPYYTPGTAGTIDNKYTRLNTQYTDIQTSGTTETDLYTYTMPANTLNQLNDTLEIKFNYILSVTGTNNIIRFYLNASTEWSFATDNTDTHMQVIIQLIRNSSTTLRGTYTIIMGDGTYGRINTLPQQASTLNFANPITIKFTGECDSPGLLQTYSLTIDKITI